MKEREYFITITKHVMYGITFLRAVLIQNNK